MKYIWMGLMVVMAGLRVQAAASYSITVGNYVYRVTQGVYANSTIEPITDSAMQYTFLKLTGTNTLVKSCQIFQGYYYPSGTIAAPWNRVRSYGLGNGKSEQPIYWGTSGANGAGWSPTKTLTLDAKEQAFIAEVEANLGDDAPTWAWGACDYGLKGKKSWAKQIQDKLIGDIGGSGSSFQDGMIDAIYKGYDVWSDSDGDGLYDWEDPDMDGDGINNDLDDDKDGDGISNDDEWKNGSSPNNPSSKPGMIDRDHDGLEDDADYDRDGVPNAAERKQGTNPYDPSSFKDTDHDGTPDYLDDDLDGDGIPDSSDTDADGDGVSNDKEMKDGTDPYDPSEHGDAGEADPNSPDIIASTGDPQVDAAKQRFLTALKKLGINITLPDADPYAAELDFGTIGNTSIRQTISSDLLGHGLAENMMLIVRLILRTMFTVTASYVFISRIWLTLRQY